MIGRNKVDILKKAKKIITSVLLCAVSLMLLCALGFYILIISGLFPRLQALWIGSAMTTYSHKYLATWFFSDEKIAEVMAENLVDDTGFDSDIFEIEEDKDPEIEVEEDPYILEGYELLSEGVYKKEASGDMWKGYLMLISDPARVKLVDTKNQFVCGQKVSQMIARAGAVAGINGGGFDDGPNYDSNGGIPAGIVIEDGRLVFPTEESLKQNPDYEYNLIGLNKDNVLILRHCTAQWAMENDIVSAVSFSPFIIVNGEGTIKKGTGGWGIAPRTAIGQRKTGEIIFFVVDGRQVGHSIGCDLLPLQETLIAEKCVNAAMMDGGSSTVMIHDGEFVNKPSLGFERYINNAWVVMPKDEEFAE